MTRAVTAGGALVLAALAYLLGGGPPAGLLLFLLPARHFQWQMRKADIDNPAACLTVFRSNRDAGLLMLAPFLLAAGLAQA